MTKKDPNEELTLAINTITEKISKVLLQEYLALPTELQISMVLIKSSQLLLANILCHIALDEDELKKILDEQGPEIKDLTLTCAYTGFGDKFGLDRH